MLQAFIAKKLIDVTLKKVMQKRAVKKMRKYVEQENELDIKVKELENDKTILIKQMDVMNNKIDKYGKTIEELEKYVSILKKNNHPPIFSKDDYRDIIQRILKLEKRRK